MAQRDWYWRMSATATQVPEFSRVEIAISDREGESATPLYTLVAFMALGSEG